jgi:poly-gamma-glutamate synthesis protein (capsule biosynthesis protein)
MSDFKIAFLGDIVPGGVLHYQNEYINNDLKQYLNTFNLRIATLESAIGDNFDFDNEKMKGRMNIIYSLETDFNIIKDININIVSIANNHIFDLGVDGFRNTIRLLKENNIKYCGAGMNIEEASAPAVIKYEDKTIAFFAYCKYGTPFIGYVPLATVNTPGINPLIVEKVCFDIKTAKKKYDYVFVLPHWGREHTFLPPYECKTMAYKMIEDGADGVIGGHPHQIQSHITYKKRPIFFSLGNFLFPDFYMYPPRPIWYPSEKENVNTIKECDEYLFPVSEPCKRVWKPLGRLGMIGEISVSKKLSSNHILSFLSCKNIAGFGKNVKKYYIIIYFIGIFIKTPFYKSEILIRKIWKKINAINKFHR